MLARRLASHPATWIAVVGLVFWVALFFGAFYVGDLVDALVHEANEVVAAPRPRPTHADSATPGSFGEALARHLPPFDEAGKDLAKDEAGKGVLDGCAKGTRPLSDLTVDQRRTMASLAPNLDGLLAGTHAATADLPSNADPFGPLPDRSWLGLQLAAMHAAIRIREEVGGGGAERAIPLCLDGLALGRDAAVSGGLVGRMINAAVVAKLAPACGDLLAALPLEAARETVRPVRAIRDAIPTFAAMMREEAIQMQLFLYGREMGAARERLLERPRRFAEEQAQERLALVEGLLRRASWRPLRGVYLELAAAAATPAEARGEAFASIDRKHPLLRAMLGDSAKDGIAGNFARYSALDFEAKQRLDLLVAAVATRVFREARGSWPPSIGELSGGAVLQPAEAARLADLQILGSPQGAGCRLEIAFATGNLAKAYASVRPSQVESVER